MQKQQLSFLQQENKELPFSYNQDKIDLLARNPEELYAFWDFSTETWDSLSFYSQLRIKLEIPGMEVVLDRMIQKDIREFYFHIPDKRGPYRVILSVVTQNSMSKVILRSSVIKAPPNHPGPGSLRFGRVPFNLSLVDLRKQGGPLPPERKAFLEGQFVLADQDSTPYTRRFK